jgi:hypothetical protein
MINLLAAAAMIWFAYSVVTKFLEDVRQNDRIRKNEGYEE